MADETQVREPALEPQTITAGRELDALVAERVMGIKPTPITVIDGTGVRADVGTLSSSYRLPDGRTGREARSLPHYSTDMAAAWQVVEAMERCGLWLMLEHCRFREMFDVEPDRFAEAGQWTAHFQTPVNCLGSECGDTAALAICRAALAAVAQEAR